MNTKWPTESQGRIVAGADELEKAQRLKGALPRTDHVEPAGTPEMAEPAIMSVTQADSSAVGKRESRESAPHSVDDEAAATVPKFFGTKEVHPPNLFGTDDTEFIEELGNLPYEISPQAATRIEPAPVPEPMTPPPPASMFEPIRQPSIVAEPSKADGKSRPRLPLESQHETLQRVLQFVARQEPGLRWAAGTRSDGTILLVTDLAHGWIPPSIALPTGVHLLDPARRSGTAAALLGQTTLSATYAPGDPMGWAPDDGVTDTSSQPRDLPPVDDLGWLLSEATRWRDGLPPIVHTLAKAGAAGTGVVGAEIDILRMYLDTSRNQLLAQYPEVDTELMLNWLLLAATEGIAGKSHLNANYHFAWFQELSGLPARGQG